MLSVGDLRVAQALVASHCAVANWRSLICLFKAQKRLRDLKGRISAQSKKNFVLERDVRYLDSRIALLIQNRMALDEVCACDR